MNLISNKKGVIEQLQSLVPAMVGIGIVLVVGFLIISEARTQVVTISGNLSLGANATTEIQEAMMQIPGWLPIFIIGIVGVLLMGLAKMFK